jgi:hypothetical protein
VFALGQSHLVKKRGAQHTCSKYENHPSETEAKRAVNTARLQRWAWPREGTHATHSGADEQIFGEI